MSMSEQRDAGRWEYLNGLKIEWIPNADRSGGQLTLRTPSAGFVTAQHTARTFREAVDVALDDHKSWLDENRRLEATKTNAEQAQDDDTISRIARLPMLERLEAAVRELARKTHERSWMPSVSAADRGASIACEDIHNRLYDMLRELNDDARERAHG